MEGRFRRGSGRSVCRRHELHARHHLRYVAAISGLTSVLQAIVAAFGDYSKKSFEDGSWAKAWESTAGKVLSTPTPPKVDRY